MSAKKIVEHELQNYHENELIFASKLYREKLSGEISEAAFYKVLERMCKEGKLVKIAKGTYHWPKVSKYGIVPPSEKEIVDAFTQDAAGTVVGYRLYNQLGLTTQIPKQVEVLSTKLDGQTKTIRNVSIYQAPLEFTVEVENMVQVIDVLQNYNHIQDMNYGRFLAYCHEFAKSFQDETFEKVYPVLKCQKSTIAFMREILDYYGTSNRLNAYLSALSTYKHPKMEEIFEAARVS